MIDLQRLLKQNSDCFFCLYSPPWTEFTINIVYVDLPLVVLMESGVHMKWKEKRLYYWDEDALGDKIRILETERRIETKVNEHTVHYYDRFLFYLGKVLVVLEKITNLS